MRTKKLLSILLCTVLLFLSFDGLLLRSYASVYVDGEAYDYVYGPLMDAQGNVICMAYRIDDFILTIGSGANSSSADCTVVAYLGNDRSDISIPEQFRGTYHIHVEDIMAENLVPVNLQLYSGIRLPVKGIAPHTFEGHTEIQSVSLPRHLDSIGESAFAGCTALEKVSFTKTDESRKDPAETVVKENAFAGCTALKTLELDNNQYDVITYDQTITPFDENAVTVTPSWSLLVEAGNDALLQAERVRKFDRTKYTYPQIVDLTEPQPRFTPSNEQADGDFRYRVTETGVEILGYTGKEAQVSVPDHIGDIPVVSIAANAFSHNHDLTAVTLPETLRSIGDYAFFLCANLTALSIPANVQEIGKAAFGFCNKMELTVDPDNQWFYLGNYILYNRFGSRALFCTEDKAMISLSRTLTTIDPYAFANRTVLESVTCPKYIDHIGEGAFLNCLNLTGFNILNDYLYKNDNRPIPYQFADFLFINKWGNTPLLIEKDAFRNCDMLSFSDIKKRQGTEEIEIKGAPSYFSDPVQEGDWLYRTGPLYTEILKYTGTDTDVTVPDKLGGKTVLSIADEAFAHQEQLFSVSLPDYCYLIGSGVFLGCTKLDTVTLASDHPIFRIDDKSGALYRKGTLILLPVARLLRDDMKPAEYNKMRVNIEEAIMQLRIRKILSGAINGNDRFTSFFLSYKISVSYTEFGSYYGSLIIEENAFYNCQALRRIYAHANYRVNLKETGNEAFMNVLFLSNGRTFDSNRHCYVSTTSEDAKGVTGVRPGFVQGGEAITAADARLALRRSVDLENYKPDSREFFCCDINNDREVTADDARHILRASVDLEDPFTEWPVYTALRLKLTKDTTHSNYNYVIK